MIVVKLEAVCANQVPLLNAWIGRVNYQGAL
jgi:hypothetical protein